MLKNFISGKIKPNTVCAKTAFGICGICNEQGQCYLDAWSNNFNNHEDVSNTNVCVDCLPLLNGDYRKRSFYITENEAKTITQKDFYNILHNLETPCILSFTDSNKKHRLFRSKITHNTSEVTITLDDRYLELDLSKDLLLLDTINNFYSSHKVSKEWILTGGYPVGAIKKIGLDRLMEFEEIVKPIRGTDRLTYLLKFCNKSE